MEELLELVKFDERGLATAVVQDAVGGQVLMVAYMNRDTLEETLRSGRMVYFSRSRRMRWLKGETSGHYQYVKEVRLDCDGDALLFKVEQKGAACHENYFSCFFRRLEGATWKIVEQKVEG